MEENFAIFSELRQVRSRLEGIEHTQEILVRAHGPQITEGVLNAFDKDPVLEEVYLLIDGQMAQQEISERLKGSNGQANSNATVTRKIRVLADDLNLIDLIEQNSRGKIYAHGAVSRILGLPRKVARRKAAREKANHRASDAG